MHVNARHYGPTLATRDGLTVIDCRSCGWAHLDPLPAVDDDYYKSEFWQKTKAGWLERYEAERDWLDMRNGDWLSVVEEHTTKDKLLDVGSGYGFFMQAACDRGWRDFGIEPSLEAVNYIPNRRRLVYRGAWQDHDPLHVFPLRFDCISALWLMEHLPNPFEFLAWCRAHLEPGGVLLLCVPQEWTYPQACGNISAAVRNYWIHPTHLNYWTAATFNNLLGRAGFRVVDTLSSYPIENYLRTREDYTADEAIGDKVHALIRAAELKLSREERLSIQRETARQAQGRDLLVVCK